MKQIYDATAYWKKASIKKAIHPLRFFSKLKGLDGSPLKILPYRQKIFSDLLYKLTVVSLASSTLAGKEER